MLLFFVNNSNWTVLFDFRWPLTTWTLRRWLQPTIYTPLQRWRLSSVAYERTPYKRSPQTSNPFPMISIQQCYFISLWGGSLFVADLGFCQGNSGNFFWVCTQTMLLQLLAWSILLRFTIRLPSMNLTKLRAAV